MTDTLREGKLAKYQRLAMLNDDLCATADQRWKAAEAKLRAVEAGVRALALDYDHKGALHRSLLHEFGTEKAEVWEGFAAELRALLDAPTPTTTPCRGIEGADIDISALMQSGSEPMHCPGCIDAPTITEGNDG